MFEKRTKKVKMENTSIRLKEDTVQSLKELSEKTNRKPTELIRMIVENYFLTTKSF